MKVKIISEPKKIYDIRKVRGHKRLVFIGWQQFVELI